MPRHFGRQIPTRTLVQSCVSCMNASTHTLVVSLWMLLIAFPPGVRAQPAPSSFVNWETAPVHPVDLSPSGRILAVCNLPDNRIELFDVSAATLQPIGSISVGLDPVTVRFRTEDELWVVNSISDSVSIATATGQRVQATLETLDEPADVLFSGSPARAFVACSA